jgi:hypothetical protein
MKYVSWIFGALFLIFGASCNILNPTANQVTVNASNEYGGVCPVVVNLDGNNTVTITNGQFYQFPLVGPGSHSLNYSTTGQCNSGNCNFGGGSATTVVSFNAVAGTIYVGAVTQSGSSCNNLSVSIN